MMFLDNYSGYVQEKFYNKTTDEIVNFLLKNYKEGVPQILIDEINKQLPNWATDAERICDLADDRYWYNIRKKEVRNIIQIYRTFQIRRNTYGYLKEFCESPYSNYFTGFRVSYLDEDDDYISIYPFLVSPYFQNLSYIFIKDYPMTEYEEQLFLKMLLIRPKLKKIELSGTGIDGLYEYINDSSLDIELIQKY